MICQARSRSSTLVEKTCGISSPGEKPSSPMLTSPRTKSRPAKWQFPEESAWDEVERLVVAACGGNQSAWEAVVERFYGFVYSYVDSLVRDRTVAEDLTQETFLRAFERVGQLRSARLFPAWLKALAKRMVGHYRRRLRRLAFEYPPADWWQSYPGPSCCQQPAKILEQQETAELVRQLVASMTRGERQTIEHFYFAGKSLREISQQFGCPVGTLKRRLHTARCRLGEQIRQLGLVE